MASLRPDGPEHEGDAGYGDDCRPRKGSKRSALARPSVGGGAPVAQGTVATVNEHQNEQGSQNGQTAAPAAQADIRSDPSGNQGGAPAAQASVASGSVTENNPTPDWFVGRSEHRQSGRPRQRWRSRQR